MDSSHPSLFGQPKKRDFSVLLREVFRFQSFRPHQQAVCESLVRDRDVLLVMPTGAGKSLCYQLPGLTRGGTTLVISPLLALIEDQVEKLKRLGLKAERIHSGRPREDSRQVCSRYLAGELDFLFIAPERLGVQGFPEMLGRRAPGLVAIDEAHCISQWGHDFRPDYRLLGDRLKLLRPAPVIAMTATATPRVQEDIVQQLRLSGEERFIHGFRRTNIAIRILEMNPSQRGAACVRLLAEPEACPAIVYAPTRKAAEALAEEISNGGRLRASVYHAGLAAPERDRVQAAYLEGRLDAIVATIAFGMGIDKADVRTVIHAGLPGSVEGYYQEIGRAGRDGLPSRAVLMHSYADLRTHEFFFERDYPEVGELDRIYSELGSKPELQDELRARLRGMKLEAFEKALEKLWAQRGATLSGESVSRGEDGWRKAYLAQREHRQAQLKTMTRLTETPGCRMLALVRHFGDRTDSGEACGICDSCRPEDACVAELKRQASEAERTAVVRILAALAGSELSAGKLYQEVAHDSHATREHSLERRDFERLLSELSRQSWVEVRIESFEKDGETIEYRRVRLTEKGLSVGKRSRDARAFGADIEALKLPELATASRKRKSSALARGTRLGSAPEASPDEDVIRGSQLFGRLREWRRGEAKTKGVPAFRILPDRVLLELCAARPGSESELLAVRGLGPKLVERYGGVLLESIRQG